MLKIFRKILVFLLIFQILNFGEVTFQLQHLLKVEMVAAQSSGIPIYTVYKDMAGGDVITSTAQSLSWDDEVSQNSEIPLLTGDTDFDLTAGWHYLVMYSIPIRSTSGSNRSEAQSWLRLNNSQNLGYGYSSSYIRRIDNDFEWYHEWSAIVNASPGDTLEVQIQRTNTNGWGLERTPGTSGINILKLDDDWDYARLRPTSAQAITTSWQDLDLTTSDELDSGTFSLSGSSLTLGDAGKYLVTYNVGWVTTGTDRTNNEARLMLDGAEIDSTRSTFYIRAQEGSFTGIASYVWIIETSSINQVLTLEIQRESTLAGTTNDTVPTKTGLTVVKIPDSADYVRISENPAAGAQDITTAVNTPLTFDTTLEQGSDLEHDTINTSEIDINTTWDYMFLHSVYNSRSDTSNGPRENPYLEWQVSGSTVGYGTSGSYNRSSNDGDGISNSSHSSAWVILPWLISWQRVELTETNQAAAGSSVYMWWGMGIQAVSLSSLFTGQAYLSQPSYRWRDDSQDFGTNSWWLAAENTDISNIVKWETLRLRMKVENPSTEIYTNDTQFELQWAQTAGSCTSSLTWTSIGDASDAWEMVDSAYISPNGETGTWVFLANTWGSTHIESEWYHAPNGITALTSSGTFVSDSQKEYEFSFRAAETALANTSYCFRLYNTQESKPLEINNYPKIQVGSTPVILDSIWGEAGKITAPANGGWTTISFTWWPYTTPVIVWRSNTHNDTNEALVFEARNVTSTGADVRLCDSNAGNATGCQNHLTETIWYMVVDASQTSSITGIEAGTFTADESFDTAGGTIVTSYVESFSQIPYVFTSIQTTNGSSPIVTRVKASSLTNFTAGICQQNSTDGCNDSHPNEAVWWIAVDPGVNPFYTDMDIGTGVSTSPSNIWSSASFSTSFSTTPVGISQTVTNNGWQDVQIDEIQNVSLTGMEFRACELDNDDDCDGHAIDDIRWIALEEWIFAAEYVLDKTHFRWYENNWLGTPSTSLSDENATLLNIPASDELRLRMLVQNADPELPVNTLSLNLQYGSGAVCEDISAWSDVSPIAGTGAFRYYDNPWITDAAILTGSLLLWWGHNLQSYVESSPTASNPNVIPAGEWGEWDFSIEDNTGTTGIQYCFRVRTQNDDEIEYSSYARIDTSDGVSPSITDFSPDVDSLLPIWTFEVTYDFNDIGSGINTSSNSSILQKWNGSGWDPDISGSYVSLDDISSTWATYAITDLSYGRYQMTFSIADIAWNISTEIHEFYVDEVEFIISSPEIDIWEILSSGIQYTSSWQLDITVKTVWAAFDVTMIKNTQLALWSWSILDWDGVKWYWYDESPYSWTPTALGAGSTTLWSEVKNLNIDGDKNTYTYTLKFSALLDIIENFTAWDYEGTIDFGINLTYN